MWLHVLTISSFCVLSLEDYRDPFFSIAIVHTYIQHSLKCSWWILTILMQYSTLRFLHRTYVHVPRSCFDSPKTSRFHWPSKTTLFSPKNWSVLMCLLPWGSPQELRKAPLQDLPQVLQLLWILNLSGYIVQNLMTSTSVCFFFMVQAAKLGRIIYNHMCPVVMRSEEHRKPKWVIIDSEGFTSKTTWGMDI